MPTRYGAPSADRYMARLTELRTGAATTIGDLFTAYGREGLLTDNTAAARFADHAAELSAGAQLEAIALADASMAQMLEDILDEPVDPLGVTVDLDQLRRNNGTRADVYRRATATARRAHRAGATEAEAIAAGARAAEQLAATDVSLAHRQGSLAAVEAHHTKRGIVGYRRVLTRESCSLCAAAATQRYRVGDLAPIHTGCDCGWAPIFGDSDPGRIINTDLLARLQSASGEGDYWRDRNLRIRPDGTILRSTGEPGRSYVVSTRTVTTELGPTLEPVPVADLDEVSTWTRDELARARREHDDLRRRIRAEAADTEQLLRDDLERRLGSASGTLAPPPRTVVIKDRFTGRNKRVLADGSDIPGEWEWWFRLDANTRKRLQKNRWVGTQQNPGAVTPDVLADRIARELGDAATDDDIFGWWLEQASTIDDARQLSLGKPPLADAADLAPNLAAEGWDVNLIAQGGKKLNDDLLDHILTRDVDLASEAAARSLPTVRHGQPPWEMDTTDWLTEIVDLDDRWPTPIGEYEGAAIYDPEGQAVIDRMTELTAPALDVPDAAGDTLFTTDPVRLHALIVETARAAGMTT